VSTGAPHFREGAATRCSRSIVRSAAPATYNETYSAAGPFVGYRRLAGRVPRLAPAAAAAWAVLAEPGAGLFPAAG